MVNFVPEGCTAHSFIHSASSRKLLRGAPNSSTAKESSLKVRKNTGAKILLKDEVHKGSHSRSRGHHVLFCLVDVQAKETRRRPCWDEWSDRELIALWRGQQSS